MDKISVIQESSSDNPFVIIRKPRSLPSAPLSEGEDSALTQAVKLFPEIKKVAGRKEIEYGLVHRIDTETEGLILIAASQEAYDFFIEQQKQNLFVKTYSALCSPCNISDESFPPFTEKIISNSCINAESRFRFFGPENKCVRPVTELSGMAARKKCCEKLYSTQIFFTDDFVHAECKIKQGFRHQVRCHLIWAGFPVTGDRLYNPLYKEGQTLCFSATGLDFLHPLTKLPVSFSVNADFENIQNK